MIWYLIQSDWDPFWVLGGTPTQWYDPSGGYFPKQSTDRVIGITVTCDRSVLSDTKRRVLRNLST
jgi:hypothetical protein